MHATFRFVQLETVNHVAWFRFNRPPRNSVHWEMLYELVPAFEQLIQDSEVRVIVIGSGVDGFYSTGADLSSFDSTGSDKMADWVAETHSIAKTIRGCPKPVFAAINGLAVGGGLEMALHADLRFADSTARFGQPEINIAFIPPVAGTQGLVRLIGRSEAFKMLYTGKVVDIAEAGRIGLVDVVVEEGELDEFVQQYAEDIAKKPANALNAIRRCLIDGGDSSFDVGLEIERAQATALAEHENFQEGVAAFLEKRAPNWS